MVTPIRYVQYARARPSLDAPALQFRVTREVPLPYSFHDTQESSDDEHHGDGPGARMRGTLRRRRMRESAVRLSGLGGVHDEEEARSSSPTVAAHP